MDGSNLNFIHRFTEIRFPSRMRVGRLIIAVASMRATEFWNRVLESCSGIVFWNRVLESCAGIVCWNRVLESCAGIVFWNRVGEWVVVRSEERNRDVGDTCYR